MHCSEVERQNKVFAALLQSCNSGLAGLRKDLLLEDLKKLMSESAEAKETDQHVDIILHDIAAKEDMHHSLELDAKLLQNMNEPAQ